MHPCCSPWSRAPQLGMNQNVASGVVTAWLQKNTSTPSLQVFILWNPPNVLAGSPTLNPFVFLLLFFVPVDGTRFYESPGCLVAKPKKKTPSVHPMEPVFFKHRVELSKGESSEPGARLLGAPPSNLRRLKRSWPLSSHSQRAEGSSSPKKKRGGRRV